MKEYYKKHLYVDMITLYNLYNLYNLYYLKNLCFNIHYILLPDFIYQLPKISYLKLPYNCNIHYYATSCNYV
jgi:hypothetical protein